MKKNRKGIIKVSRCFIDDLSYDELSEIFKDVIVLNVEIESFADRFIYYCISKYFDEVENGCVYNEYTIEVETDNDKNIINRKFVKQ